MEKFKMPTNQEVKDQAEKGLHMNAPRITLMALELISAQIYELNKKLDQALNIGGTANKQKPKKRSSL